MSLSNIKLVLSNLVIFCFSGSELCNVLGMIYENAIYDQRQKHKHNIPKKVQQRDICLLPNPDHFWSTQFGGWQKTVSLEWVGHYYAKVALCSALPPATCSNNLHPESPLLIASH